MTIPLLALVALTEDIPDHKLTRGQIGSVVEHLERDGDWALLVEFYGHTYAVVPVQPQQLIVLHRGQGAGHAPPERGWDTLIHSLDQLHRAILQRAWL